MLCYTALQLCCVVISLPSAVPTAICCTVFALSYSKRYSTLFNAAFSCICYASVQVFRPDRSSSGPWLKILKLHLNLKLMFKMVTSQICSFHFRNWGLEPRHTTLHVLHRGVSTLLHVYWSVWTEFSNTVDQ